MSFSSVTLWCRRKENSSVKLLNNSNGSASEMTKPTIDEMKNWKHDFHALLSSKYGVNQFQEFLRSQYGEENLCFWLAVEDYRRLEDRESRRDMARMIYEDYVSTLSPTEISLDAKIRATVDKSMSDPDQNTFDPAQDHIYTLMYHDCFPRFIKSKHYKNLIKSS
ncbi:predicted protein [Nematostella vectensis]|uniref:RGS domain-containing protein n=1 Tax=Nematostella vectensis TaxID=45351 RepID=A7SU35_NEMVE|nr:predicted protein [Nematostella vectensis]|eukprot:XP_001624904.1 predicted protein [Nematostella vectensis]